MEEPNVSQVSSFPPPPMHYANMYTEENITRHLAPPPPPPIQGHYSVFGVVSNTDDPIIPPLEAHGIRRLYAQSAASQSQHPSSATPTSTGGGQSQTATQIDRKTELKKLNHSILAAYLDLLELLIRSPTNQAERERKMEDLQLLFINFHHLINEYRPHQARETLKLMLEVQAQERLNVVKRFRRHFNAVVDNLQQCLKEIPNDLLSSTAALAIAAEAAGDGGGEDRSSMDYTTTTKEDTSKSIGQSTSTSEKKERGLDSLMCKIIDEGNEDH